MAIMLDTVEQIENITPIAGTEPANRSYRLNRTRSPYGPRFPKTKDRSMTLLLIALLVAFAAATGIVLADSGLRLWSAFGGIAAQQAKLRDEGLPELRAQRPACVITRVSFARPATMSGVAPRRAAA